VKEESRVSKTKPFCPRCGKEMFEVFYDDQVRRWRCMRCEEVFSELEYELRDRELVRRYKPNRLAGRAKR